MIFLLHCLPAQVPPPDSEPCSEEELRELMGRLREVVREYQRAMLRVGGIHSRWSGCVDLVNIC
jgi:hypothetical protein